MRERLSLKGSAILVVIFSSIAFFIYVMSVYSETEHFSIIQNKYEKHITEKYEVNEIEFYEKTLKNIKF